MRLKFVKFDTIVIFLRMWYAKHNLREIFFEMIHKSKWYTLQKYTENNLGPPRNIDLTVVTTNIVVEWEKCDFT